MPHNLRVAAVVLANALLVVAIGIFAAGFFPYKAFIPGLATWQSDSVRSTSAPPFDKVIFMVVDALRSDFVYSNASNFHFTQSLIRDGAAVPFTGHASPPTITMPRVKAITTGSVPSFVDLVLNFAESDTTSTLATQDSWLAQLKAKNTGKLLMYGDDTWLRLFPGFFDRADGTTSFFVSDFTEVDNNVTRHIDTELQTDDWTAMTFHFLGLDHIGHKTGPKGPNMPAKQAEMDGIIRAVYQAMESESHLASTLLVLLGDHGMNEAGNHGANSAGEVSTALTFISPKLKGTFHGHQSPTNPGHDFDFYNTVEQSDIAPTLAALLDFPVPLNNLGVVIPQLLQLWPEQQDRFSLLFENARQIQKIASATFSKEFDPETLNTFDCTPLGDLSDAEELACLWQQIGTTRSEETLQTFLYKAQKALSGTASNYDTGKLLTGSIISVVAVSLAIIALIGNSSFSGLPALLFTIMTLLYAITMFASSYVEEEHQFWYWFSGGYLALLYFKASRFSSKATAMTPSLAIVLAILLSLFTKKHLTTGQKYAGDPDILTTFLIPHPHLLWPLILLSYTIPTYHLARRSSLYLQPSTSLRILPILTAASTLIFKVAFTAADAPELVTPVQLLRPILDLTRGYPLVNLARLAFFGLAQLFACVAYYEAPWRSLQHLRRFIRTAHDVIALFLITQTRAQNIPLYAAWMGTVWVLEKAILSPSPTPTPAPTTSPPPSSARSPPHADPRQQPAHLRTASSSSPPSFLTPTEITTLALLTQHASFFSLGGTNAISSVDLSNAYNGTAGYNVLAVGVLTFVSNWAGPLWWSVASLRLLLAVAVVADGGGGEGTKGNELVEGEGKGEGGKSTENGDGNGKGNGKVRSLAFEHFTQLTVFAAASTCAVMVACFVLREHLFIWTVFSPKYLYLVAWVVGQHLVVNGVLATGGLCLSRW